MKKQGFTIVELLVVIVVIAILAAITIVGYNWVTSDARDSARRAAAKEVQKLATALQVKKDIVHWSRNTATLTDGLCTTTASASWAGVGWAADSAYPSGCTIGDMLVAAGMTTSALWDNIPKNEEKFTNSRNATQIIGDCAGEVYLFYYVKNATQEEVSLMDNLATKCSSRITGVRDTYAMRAALKIK